MMACQSRYVCVQHGEFWAWPQFTWPQMPAQNLTGITFVNVVELPAVCPQCLRQAVRVLERAPHISVRST
jgi:hypothetical protein